MKFFPVLALSFLVLVIVSFAVSTGAKDAEALIPKAGNNEIPALSDRGELFITNATLIAQSISPDVCSYGCPQCSAYCGVQGFLYYCCTGPVCCCTNARTCPPACAYITQCAVKQNPFSVEN